MPDAGPGHSRAARVARRIEADVIGRGWPIGESLGSEPGLREQYGVSRSVLREAVRLVEHHQVARMRRGPNGGLFVTVPDAGPATRAVLIYLDYLGISVDELLDARLLLEPLAAGLAAERIDEDGIIRLRELAQAASQRGHNDFHVGLAQLTGNPVLALFIEVLIRLTTRFARSADPPAAAVVDEGARQLVRDHQGIVEAVTAGDALRSRTLTAEHVQTVTGWLRARRRVLRGAAPPASARGKRAEQLAVAMYDDIVAGGWRIGSVFGGEHDLLERYGVSRSVLREAVRLLEYHSVARMRRGPGGGLMITEPQPDAAVDTMALHLDYRGPSRDDLRLVREAIEVDCVAAVVRRRADADVAAFCDRQAAAAQAGDESEQAGMAELDFHDELSELAGNRVLTLFLRILVELLLRHWTPTRAPLPDARDAREMHHAHSRIIEAIRDGDDSLAQHRTRRHLEALSSWWV